MLPQPGEGERLAVLEADVVRLLPAVELLPLAEAIGHDEAEALAERLAEGRLGGHGVGPGVNHAAADDRVSGLGRYQPPPEQGHFAARAALADPNGRHRLGRGDVEAGRVRDLAL
jgi:hypothetical protein